MRNNISRYAEACAITEQGTQPKWERQNGAKSAPLISATRQGNLRAARTEQRKNRFRYYGEFYHLNYYKEVKEKGRTYYEVYSLQRTEEVPEDYKEISFVCLRSRRGV